MTDNNIKLNGNKLPLKVLDSLPDDAWGLVSKTDDNKLIISCQYGLWELAEWDGQQWAFYDKAVKR